MRASIAPAPTDPASAVFVVLHDPDLPKHYRRVVATALEAVYAGFCTGSAEELQAAVEALTGIPADDEGAATPTQEP